MGNQLEALAFLSKEDHPNYRRFPDQFQSSFTRQTKTGWWWLEHLKKQQHIFWIIIPIDFFIVFRGLGEKPPTREHFFWWLAGEQQSLDACELLAGTTEGNAARVINEELKAVSDQEVQAGTQFSCRYRKNGGTICGRQPGAGYSWHQKRSWNLASSGMGG